MGQPSAKRSPAPRSRARFWAAAWTALIALVLLVPVPDLPVSREAPWLPVRGDLLVHGVLFFVLVPLLGRARGGAYRWAVGWAAVYAAFTEALQGLLPYRTAEGSDLLADLVGAVLAYGWCTLRARGRSHP